MRIRLCKCKRAYTYFSCCTMCFFEVVDMMNKGKTLKIPIPISGSVKQ
jgi:hypothetical protein